MKPSALAGFLSVLILSAAVPAWAEAQWSISLGVGADRFWGGSVENAPERRSFRPYRPTTVTAALERRSGRICGGLTIRYTEASLGLEGSDAVAAIKGAFTVVGVSPELSYQLAVLGAGNQLLVHAGPLFEFWDLIDADSRIRLGAQGAVSLNVPLGGRFALSLAGSVALISSPFEADELADGYDLRALWRRGFAAGLQYRL
jgi:hypothetical protein